MNLKQIIDFIFTAAKCESFGFFVEIFNTFQVDLLENYNPVSYKLSDTEGKTLLKLTIHNISSEKEHMQSTENWKNVLNKLQEVVKSDEEK